ncbi:TPA: hypothetical protein ACTZ5W_003719 [Bacillus cereus]
MGDTKVQIEELPIHRFYFSYQFLMSDVSYERLIGENTINELYIDMYSYYEESLGLLRSTRKLFETINKDIQVFEERYTKIGEKIQKRKEECETEEDFADYEIVLSRYLERQNLYYRDRDIEINAFSSGMIVQLLSLFESTLHSICKKLMESDQNLPDIKQVCSRDKGSVKYLKYMDKCLDPSVQNVLIGTPKYEKLCSWIAIRNNIVHNNNEFREELNNNIEKHGFSVNKLRNKFLFNKDSIQELADICGITMDIIVDKKLRIHFMESKKDKNHLK